MSNQVLPHILLSSGVLLDKRFVYPVWNGVRIDLLVDTIRFSWLGTVALSNVSGSTR